MSKSNENRLDALLLKLKIEKGITAKTVIDWMVNVKNIPCSPSNLSNYRKVGAIATRQYNIFLEAVEEYSLHETPPVMKKKQSKFAYFSSRIFSIYYRRENDSNMNYEIHKAILNIGKSKNDIELLLPTNDSDYLGHADILDNESHLVLNLKTSETKEKALRIIIFIPHGKTPEVALGQYMNLNSKGAIVSGSIVLQLLDDKSHRSSPQIYKSTSETYKEIPTSFQNYLYSSEKNRLKTTTGIFSERDLGKFLHIQKLKAKDNSLKKGIFLAAPIGELDKEEYQLIWEEYEEIHSKILDKFSEYEICFLGRDAKSTTTFESNILSMRKMLGKIKLLDKFILIYPKKAASTALIELGAALALEKQCLIFVKDKKDLPSLLKNQHFKNLSIIIYETTQDILILFEELGDSIFEI